MPELPEIETIKEQLSAKIIGKKIKNAEIFYPGIINMPPDEFNKKITGFIVSNIKRKAKNLIIELKPQPSDPSLYLLFHLKMTGQLIYQERATAGVQNFEPLPGSKHTRLIFHFSDGSKLLFNDIRKFGYVKLLSENELEENFKKQNFGIDPFEKEFTLEKFREILKDKKGKIKQVLMDQTFIAGIGNLYSAEICFYAKVKPERQLHSLSDQEIKDIYKGIKKILALAVLKKGSSVDNYIDIYGKQGGFVPLLKVYGRKGKKCYRCGETIQAVKLGGRGTYFCPKCQK